MTSRKTKQPLKSETKGTVQKSFPKTTRPAASSRREQEPEVTTGEKIKRRLDAHPDRIDVRDWFYQPPLASLPDQIINCASVPSILDQGREGACTGYALAAVINYLLGARNIDRHVSPRMLYEMARRYDEWPRENYSGSSARGAMKGWVAHGVCAHDSWPPEQHGAKHLTLDIAREGQSTPGGAYYRVMHRQIRDMHAAIAEIGIIYVTLMVHRGWQEPGPRTVNISFVEHGNVRELELPIINRVGRADGGHAVAIVGYTAEGFIVQNSWGRDWGARGFALLPYEDYMLHATDVWAAQLGVPVRMDTWQRGEGYAETTAGLQRATRAIPLSEIRPFVIDVGNNGELSSSGKYWTSEEDLKRLFTQTIPEETKSWKRRRVLLYLHGGLNDETDVARRIVAFRDVFLKNEIYPLHIMWESGIMESLNSMIRDLFTGTDERKRAVADWLNRVREGLLEARDRTFELTAAAPGGALWREMKENARLASSHPERRGGMQLLVKYAQAAMKKLNSDERAGWELHVVGHSAGSIFAAYAMQQMVNLGVTFKTLHLMAPAITVELFKKKIVPLIDMAAKNGARTGKCPHPTLYILSDVGERDDDVGPYGKSLLYLVSNAFEGERETPLLGMERFVSEIAHSGKEGGHAEELDLEMNEMFKKQINGLPSLIVAGMGEGPKSISRSDTHGGFDNDEWTLNSVLRRILGDEEPQRIFTLRDLQY